MNLGFVLVAASTLCAQPAATSPEALDRLANRFVQQQLAYDPTLAYSIGLASPDNARFPDRSPRAIEAAADEERRDLAELLTIDFKRLPDSSKAAYAALREHLEADLQLRICKAELWSVDHIDGWQSKFAEVADQQPVSTAVERADALARWSAFPSFLDTEIANLKLGLTLGYSAAQSVVRRVINQIDVMAAGTPDKSPFYSPVARSKNPTFQTAFRNVIVSRIVPALRGYQTYLKDQYLPKARMGVAIYDLPNGPACYGAFLRSNTTLMRTPRQIYDLGEQTVAAYQADVLRIGAKAFGTSSVQAALAADNASPANRFTSREDLLAESRGVLALARARTATTSIDRMPVQAVVVEPLRPFEEAAGADSRIETQSDITKPAIYRINLNAWKTETRGKAAVVVAHEAWPGHHLQLALASELRPNTPLSKLVSNSAYAEGWARYAEAMAEETGILTTPDALIQRRIWPAHGMVIDPGLHAFQWTRRQAVDYLLTTGQYTSDTAEALIDRIAVMPGQLTAYDTGGLEIGSLRRQAETALGARFDLRNFNYAVIEEGNVPLAELRRHVEAWIKTTAAGQH